MVHRKQRVRLPKVVLDFPDAEIERRYQAAVEAQKRSRWDAARRSA